MGLRLGELKGKRLVSLGPAAPGQSLVEPLKVLFGLDARPARGSGLFLVSLGDSLLACKPSPGFGSPVEGALALAIRCLDEPDDVAAALPPFRRGSPILFAGLPVPQGIVARLFEAGGAAESLFLEADGGDRPGQTLVALVARQGLVAQVEGLDFAVELAQPLLERGRLHPQSLESLPQGPIFAPRLVVAPPEVLFSLGCGRQ